MTDPILDNAMRLRRAGRLEEAAALYAQALASNPKNYDVLHAFGTLRYQTGQLEEAEKLIASALAVNPAAVDALYNRACLLTRLGRLDDAVNQFAAAIRLKPDYIEALTNRGTTLIRMGRFEEALADFDAIAMMRPNNLPALHNRASVLLRLQRFADARAAYDRVLALDVKYADSWLGRSIANLKLREYTPALKDADHAVALAPTRAQAWECKGNALNELQRWDDAISAYTQALAFGPGNSDVLHNRGLALVQARRFSEAIRDFEAVIAAAPENAQVRGDLLLARLASCQWDGIERLKSEVASALDGGTRAANPFVALLLGRPGQPDPVAERAAFAAARLTAEAEFPPQKPLATPRSGATHDKIRIAYVSGDFAEHPVARLMAGVFEVHDRERFEPIAVSFGPPRPSAMRTRLESAFSRFIDCHDRSEADIARAIYETEADIAVDLMGYTQGSRTPIFAHRPAPLQVNYLGFPGGMGAPYYDYLIADAVVIPGDAGALYSEKIVHLPHSYLPADKGRAIARAPSRAEAGLPEQGFVFAAFNNPYKFAPEIFAIWMRLLKAVSNSVLWLAQAPEAAQQNLKREAQARGIAPDRLVFAPYVTGDAEHLARLSLAGIFLDTLPYNAHATAMDSLWAGVPVVTLEGRGFAGRVATSLVTAAGMPELAAQSLAEYELLALHLARDATALAAAKSKLANARNVAPLFDTVRFARNLESAFATMWERHRRGEEPSSFAVRASGTP